MKTYTVIVEVNTDLTQREVFMAIERAVECATGEGHDRIHISTPDGTNSVLFTEVAI